MASCPKHQNLKQKQCYNKLNKDLRKKSGRHKNIYMCVYVYVYIYPIQIPVVFCQISYQALVF